MAAYCRPCGLDLRIDQHGVITCDCGTSDPGSGPRPGWRRDDGHQTTKADIDAWREDTANPLPTAIAAFRAEGAQINTRAEMERFIADVRQHHADAVRLRKNLVVEKADGTLFAYSGESRAFYKLDIKAVAA